MGDLDVEVDSGEELFLGDFFVGGVGHVNGAGAEEQRLPPVAELRNVGGELGNHGGQTGDRVESHEGDFEREVGFGKAGDGVADGSADGGRVADEADEDLGLGFVGDNVGGVAALDQADIEGAGADVFDGRERNGQDAFEGLDELVNRTVAELGIGRVGHFAGGADDDAKSALGCESEAVIGRFAIDKEATAFGMKIGSLGAGRVAFFAGDKEEADFVALGTERFGSGHLGGEDSLGVGDAATVEVFRVFAGGDIGRYGVEVGGKDQVRRFTGGSGIDIRAVRLGCAFEGLLNGGLFDGPATEVEEIGKEVGERALGIGRGIDCAEGEGECDGIERRCRKRTGHGSARIRHLRWGRRSLFARRIFVLSHP